MAPASRKRRVVADEVDEESDRSDAPRSTQRQRRQNRDDDSDEDSEQGETMLADREEMDMEEQGSEDSQGQLIKKLVRYALACEYSRIPIKRDGIRDKVLGKYKAPFKKIFDGAQHQLKTKFGMEMVELPTKEKVTLKDRRAAAQKASQAPVSSRSYILTSTLPPKYCIPSILAPSIVPEVALEGAYIGLYTAIISIIMLHGGQIPDPKLQRYLRRMNADVNTPIDKTELVLQKMVKQNYLIRVKEVTENDQQIEWYVGPRGKIEVGNRGVVGLVRSVYGEDAPEDLDARLKSSLGLGDTPEDGEEDEEAPEVADVVVNGNSNDGENDEGSSRRAPGRRRRAVEGDDD